MIFEISQNIARKVFEKAISDIDDYLRSKRERGKLKNPILPRRLSKKFPEHLI